MLTKPPSGRGLPRISSVRPFGRFRSNAWGSRSRARPTTDTASCSGSPAPYSPRRALKSASSPSDGRPASNSESGNSSSSRNCRLQSTMLKSRSKRLIPLGMKSTIACSASSVDGLITVRLVCVSGIVSPSCCSSFLWVRSTRDHDEREHPAQSPASAAGGNSTPNVNSVTPNHGPAQARQAATERSAL